MANPNPSTAGLIPLDSARAREIASKPRHRLSAIRLGAAFQRERKAFERRNNGTYWETELARILLSVSLNPEHPKWWDVVKELLQYDPMLQAAKAAYSAETVSVNVTSLRIDYGSKALEVTRTLDVEPRVPGGE